eukprot:CAMPEP_0197620974 /NCGR_PEP_ID=MMETSP1338-20131121/1651_1 /TAXON_ID=43686 ORGANISM="Pelagodinium beii, Strain RCC1491" /NCGR_SAMPLE_ID=MMETSP1338 /ASSEMBLY_ACC=CAM_ASM_000754 /LENGTH=91 /DNA_ID=CAMNT_0043190291 /DNA_START=58 /DNA_END=333 /DNA_ORIENTATION=-
MAESTGSAGRGGAAASVGGSRTALARRTAGRTGAVASSGANSGKKASGGILKFYSDDTPGLKVGPTTVLVMSLVFMAIVCSLHILGKFRSS